MGAWLWAVPALPLLGFLILTLARGLFSHRGAAVIGVGSVALATAVAGLIGHEFVQAPPESGAWNLSLWRWMAVDGFTPGIAFHLDALALVMMLVITFVALLIHLYAARFMAGEEGYVRFFAYMNLFVAAMVLLVLADNLLLLYLGWEGVGLCSYLLIGFWYHDAANGWAARKAFVMTRIGDTALLVGILLLALQFGTFEIQPLLGRAAEQWSGGGLYPTLAALLLLGGALGKSAQLPLHTWLPDAMAGPTPVSALIHAATMVTAGVYLIARTHGLFLLAPEVLLAVAVIGAVTLVLAGFGALAQTDIKRVLAYSTISQVGYMFLALGVGAWSAAIFHFMTHAFFKALLFLSAGAVILALHHEHDIFRMGRLWRRMPGTTLSFLVGSAALAALPLVTAGFYSKELILWEVWTSEAGRPWLWGAGLLGAFVTSLYIFRVVIIAFFGPGPVDQCRRTGWAMGITLLLLTLLSIGAGLVEWPVDAEGRGLFTGFLQTALPAGPDGEGGGFSEGELQILTSLVVLAGVLLAWLVRWRGVVWLFEREPLAVVRRFWLQGWGFDRLYYGLVVRPFLATARVSRRDWVDGLFDGVAWVSRALNHGLSRTQSGLLRWYATGIAAGAVTFLAIAVFA